MTDLAKVYKLDKVLKFQYITSTVNMVKSNILIFSIIKSLL